MNADTGRQQLARELVRSRVRASPRVRALLGAALEGVAPIWGLSLSAVDALLLAEVGDVAEALRLVSEQAAVRRAAPAMTLTEEAQTSIAVAQVVAEARGVAQDANSRRALLARLIEEHTKLERGLREREHGAESVEQLLGEEDRYARELRRFLRHAAVKRTAQRNRLALAIVDPERRRQALERLDEIYTLHLRVALSLPTLDEARRR